jgi:hypothetical protein
MGLPPLAQYAKLGTTTLVLFLPQRGSGEAPDCACEHCCACLRRPGGRFVQLKTPFPNTRLLITSTFVQFHVGLIYAEFNPYY